MRALDRRVAAHVARSSPVLRSLFGAASSLRLRETMKPLLHPIRLVASVGYLASLLAANAACETRERVVVRGPPVERVYVRPQPVVVQERVIVR
jgi:hypothetical protein